MSSKWMVDVKGQGCVDTERVLADLEMEEDLKDSLCQSGGLITAVRNRIEAGGHSISDSGGGGCSWHLGVPFDELEEAVGYVKYISSAFASAIRAKMLRVELKTWSYNRW